MKGLILAAVLLCGAAHAADIDWAGARSVTVGMVDDVFVPDKLTFKAGVPYRLRLENRGKEMHEFTAPEFLKTVEVKNPEVLEQAGNEVLVQPGNAKELLFVARKPGRYPLTCADHDWDGMVGEITVE
ncbi:MAG TPA: cupredoxin domain-containing protein [Burkholderiales bacterium]|nr:cupredoxin domain-containing protein [Burkholderiales bacterium]